MYTIVKLSKLFINSSAYNFKSVGFDQKSKLYIKPFLEMIINIYPYI